VVRARPPGEGWGSVRHPILDLILHLILHLTLHLDHGGEPNRSLGFASMRPAEVLSLLLFLLGSCASMPSTAPTPALLEDDDEHGEHRPAQIEHVRVRTPYNIEAGVVETDLVFAFLDSGNFKRLDADNFQRSGFKFEAYYAVTESLFAEIELPFEWVDDGSRRGGLADVDVELKYLLPSVESLDLDVAVGVEVEFPSGNADRDLGRESIAFELFAVFARELGDAMVYAELGVELEENEEQEYQTKAAVDWSPWSNNTNFQLALGLGTESGESPELTITPGVGTRIGEFKLGLGIPIGLNHAAPNWGAILAFEFEF
jgi:Putative MetA-pathway of phenol degradation